jgi:hypothetical protein
LIFLDESGAKTNMTRLYGRAPVGQRVLASAPAGRWQSTTMISAIRLDGKTACMTLDGATDTGSFRAYVKDVLVPTLRPGDVVVMDNLSPHKSEPTLEMILQARSAGRIFAALLAGLQSDRADVEQGQDCATATGGSNSD